MNDTQVLTICITLLGIFAASWFNSSRIGDVSGKVSDLRGDTNGKISDLKEVLRAEMKAFEAQMNLQFERTNRKIDDLLSLIGDHEQRITTLEAGNR
jgi:hypothetical protein